MSKKVFFRETKLRFSILSFIFCLDFVSGFAIVSAAQSSTTSKWKETSFQWKNPPYVDADLAKKVPIQIGGLSSAILTNESEKSWELLLLMDRGPNSDPIPFIKGVGKNVRVFPLPKYSPEILTVSLRKDLSDVTVVRRMKLRDKKGVPLSGLNPVVQTESNQDSTEVPVTLEGKKITPPKTGIDPEGMCLAADRSLWVVEEYLPSLMHFSAKGNLINSVSPGHGIPDFFSLRIPNRGFEGVVCSGDKLYAILQSPLQGSPMKYGLLLEFDVKQGKASGLYLYPFEENMNKISEITMHEGFIYAVELNGLGPDKIDSKIYRFALSAEKNILSSLGADQNSSDKLFEFMKSAKNRLLSKELVIDLKGTSIGSETKIESMVFLEKSKLLLITDNDFSLASNLVFGVQPNWEKVFEHPNYSRFSIFEETVVAK